jgi:hypothetical protein
VTDEKLDTELAQQLAGELGNIAAVVTGDEASRYGFRWGPMVVTRLAEIPKRGYVLEIKTEHTAIQVLVSEKGRRITACPPYKPPRGRRADVTVS